MGDAPDLNYDEDEEVADKRRDLERLAFGRADGPEEERVAIEARRALAQLLDHRPAIVSPEQEAQTPPVEGPSDPAQVGQLSFGLKSETEMVRAPRPRRVLVAVAAVFLLLGVVVGSIATSVQQTSAHPASAATTSPTPQDPVSAASEANRWFDGRQAATDKYSFAPPGDVGFVKASTRLVANSSVFGRVWIAKKAGTASGYCMMTEGPLMSDGSRTGSMMCASMLDFLLHGISVPEPDGTSSVHWAGGEVSINVAG
ncbi:MAG: hypothetical protein QOH44_201 [Actinomycetota bacterium]|jgi:hypothetical protein|nr:hypothetical protein [Actinomycetota bacterium]